MSCSDTDGGGRRVGRGVGGHGLGRWQMENVGSSFNITSLASLTAIGH